jgi:zinc transport system ATP-binding protein
MLMTTPLLDLCHVSVGYDDALVVDDVSLTVDRGESVALVGSNGSGKSTLVRALVGVTPLSDGEVLVDGQPRDVDRGGTRIGYVPQHHSLTTAVSATVGEIVVTARLAVRPWWRPAGRADREAVRDAIDAVGLSDRVHDEVAALSGGQQRRVLIARALASQPDLLVMDEPTAGVDVASQAVLADVLTGLRGRGLTMLIVTHELDHLESAVSRVVQLDHGRLAFDGSLSAFLTSEGAARLGHCHNEALAHAHEQVTL